LWDRQKLNIPAMIKDVNEAVDIGLKLIVIDLPRSNVGVEFTLQSQVLGEAAAANTH
jgi:hypothetical protein